MKEIRQTAIKALLFLLLLAGLNLLYRHTSYRDEILREWPKYPQVEEAADADIIFFGESSNTTYGDYDVSKAAIHEFLGQHYPSLKVRGITQVASHAGHFLDMMRHLPDTTRAKVVVVTMNLRAFNAQWRHAKLEGAMAKKFLLLGPGPALWRRFLFAFRQYPNPSEAEQTERFLAEWRADTLRFPYPCRYTNVIVWDSILAAQARNAQDPKRHADIVLSTHYVKAFAYHLDTLTDPRLRDFDRIMDMAGKRGWKVVINILPENTERARDFFGDTLMHFMDQNAAWLKRHYTAKGAIVADLHDILRDENFLDKDWTTEHYDETGRRKVAAGLAEAIRPLFPTAYQPIDIARLTNGHSHLCDCDKAEKWSQLHTCTPGEGRNGSSGSRTDAKERFSITYTAKVPNLDTTRLDTIRVSFYMRQERLDHYAGLALEASGDHVPYQWDTLGLRRFCTAVGEWAPVTVDFPVKPGLRLADVMKVYVFNPGQSPVWVDDMRVTFVGR